MTEKHYETILNKTKDIIEQEIEMLDGSKHSTARTRGYMDAYRKILRHIDYLESGVRLAEANNELIAKSIYDKLKDEIKLETLFDDFVAKLKDTLKEI